MKVVEVGVELRGVDFACRPQTALVLREVTARFDKGTTTAITGGSGTGKSTLLYLAALMLRPTAGQVSWEGEVISGLSDAARSRARGARAGFVFQDAMLDPSRTVLDNVVEPAVFSGLARPRALNRARELLTNLGVAHRADHRPGEISGGQAQRVGLARALLNDPAIMFADEPTGNLDRLTADLVWETLTAQASTGTCVIIATHDERISARADQQLAL